MKSNWKRREILHFFFQKRAGRPIQNTVTTIVGHVSIIWRMQTKQQSDTLDVIRGSFYRWCLIRCPLLSLILWSILFSVAVRLWNQIVFFGLMLSKYIVCENNIFRSSPSPMLYVICHDMTLVHLLKMLFWDIKINDVIFI